MKKYLLLFIYIFVVSSFSAQVQQGVVKTKGRLNPDGSVTAGVPLSGAFVTVRDAQTVASNKKGQFSVSLTNRDFYLKEVSKEGYALCDADALSRPYAYSEKPLYIVMETPSQQQEDKLMAERKLRKTLQKQLQQREEEIDSLKASQQITDEEYRKTLQKIYSDQEENERLISDMSERYAKIDYDQLDEFNQRISNCILEGRLTKADSLIRAKGNMQTRVSAFFDLREQNQLEEQRIKQRLKKLEKNKAYERQELEDLAQDCYSLFEIFKMQHKNDSAAYYLELRASLDTTNINWINQIGEFYYEYVADYAKSLMFYQLSVKEAIRQYGNSNETLGGVYSNIGDVYQRQGKFDDAMRYYKKALEIADGENKNLYNISTCQNNIGMVYVNKGNYDKALEHLEKSLEMRVKLYGQEDNNDIATSYYHIGMAYMYLQSYQKALDYYQKSLDIRKRIYGDMHQEVANSVYSIGFLYFQQGNYEAALPMYEEAWMIYYKIYGESHPFLATCINGMGGIYARKKDYIKALDYYKRALSIRIGVYGKNHPQIANSLNNIGSIYDYQAEYEKALEYYQEALNIKRIFYEDNHPSVAVSYNNIGGIYYSKGNYRTALDFYEKAYKIYQNVYGLEHAKTKRLGEKIGILRDLISKNLSCYVVK